MSEVLLEGGHPLTVWRFYGGTVRGQCLGIAFRVDHAELTRDEVWTLFHTLDRWLTPPNGAFVTPGTGGRSGSTPEAASESKVVQPQGGP